jgi:Carboxypeptidase regulatory-like domain
VRGGHSATGIDATLIRQPVGSISGRVTGATGDPLGNICVAASAVDAVGGSSSITSPNGHFDIRNLTGGRYSVSYSPCSAARNLVTVTKAAHLTAPGRVRLNARLVAGGSISGLVQAAEPTPTGVADLCIQVIGAGGNSAHHIGFTGPGGSYQVTGLRAGKYLLSFGWQFCSLGEVDLVPQWFDGKQNQANATPVEVTVGQTTSGIDATLLPNGGITGKVTGPNAAAVNGACVTADPFSGAGATELAVSRAGTYTLASLPPGRYRIKFSSGCGAAGYRTQWWRHTAKRSLATVVRVRAGRTLTGINAALRR